MNKIIKIIVIFIIIILIGTVSLAESKDLIINDETFSFNSKQENISSNFNTEYGISNNNDNNQNDTEIEQLTKKVTYLLLGDFSISNEGSENYYKRYKDYLNLRYAPEIPKDTDSFTGLDENSQEYKDDLLSGISLPNMFDKLNELEIKYNSYGEIRTSIIDENNIVSSITLSDIRMKEQDYENPMEYNTVKCDLTIYYYFKKLNNEYKLLYLYSETNDEIENYIEQSEEKEGELSKDSDYDSNLEEIYDFTKAEAITDEQLSKIYNENNSKIVFLQSLYNTGINAKANGFFISEGLIVTTYNYIEQSLLKSQNIVISDSLGNVYQLEGLVTMDEQNDIAILKLKEKNQTKIDILDIEQLQKEDAVITLNSKLGIGLTTAKGIITAIDKKLQTSLPVTEEIQGSPLFNSNGNLIGMINSKSLNSSISYATELEILKQYYNKFINMDFNEIKAISFEELKDNYYIKSTEEKILKDIPEKKWKQYSKAENIDENISLDLIKSSYKDGIISLRYKNNIQDYIDVFEFINPYRENLKDKGYEEKKISDSKYIYENKKYQIIITKEFDYLIVIMVKV